MGGVTLEAADRSRGGGRSYSVFVGFLFVKNVELD
jgi:hypothetical protein